MITGLHLGCPIWARKDWVGELFAPGTKPADYLREYARTFNTVEGNTTFYAAPSAETVARWAEQTPDTFRFCFKFPRAVSHEGRLRDRVPLALDFLKTLAPLGPRLGPTFLQLPARVGPEALDDLDRFLLQLPDDLPLAVEVRHAAFFRPGSAQSRLEDSLRRLGVDRVLMDSEPYYRSPEGHPALARAINQKPRVPNHVVVTGRRPFVRFYSHADPDENHAALAVWAERVAGWLEQELEPYFFVHHPDDFHSPALARVFHKALSKHRDVGHLAPKPTAPRTGQLSLL